MSIDGTVTGVIAANDRRTVGLTLANIPVSSSASIAFTNGSGANQVNVLYQNTLTSAGTDSIDLSGVLTDNYTSTVSLLRVKAIQIKNLSATNNIVVGAGTNPFIGLLNSTGTITLPPGAFFEAATPDATGWAVTASSGDILKIVGTSGQTYSLVILGASS